MTTKPLLSHWLWRVALGAALLFAVGAALFALLQIAAALGGG